MRPLFKPKCSYLTQEWREGPQFQTKGEGDNLTWPALTVGSLDRVIQSGVYEVEWTYPKGAEKETFSRELPETEYLSWKMGQPVYARVTVIGSHLNDYSATPFTD